MFHTNGTTNDPNQFYMLNAGSIDKNPNFESLNLSSENVRDFIDKLKDLMNKKANETVSVGNGSDSIACQMCNEFINDMCSSYKDVHGYISLVVSTECEVVSCELLMFEFRFSFV